jgi:hypothetical protein
MSPTGPRFRQHKYTGWLKTGAFQRLSKFLSADAAGWKVKSTSGFLTASAEIAKPLNSPKKIAAAGSQAKRSDQIFITGVLP